MARFSVTTEKVEQIATAMLGHLPARTEAFAPGIGGDDSLSFRIWHGRDAMLFKMSRRRGRPMGIQFHERLLAAGIPVPELVAFAGTAGPGARACAIWEWIDGVPVDFVEGQPCPYDEAELGTLLRRIHDLPAEEPYGALGDDPFQRSFSLTSEIAPTSDSWPHWFRWGEAACQYVDRGYINDHEASILVSLPDRMTGHFSTVQPRLLHMGDIMHHGNLIIAPGSGEIIAVLDYVESMSGDPRYELAWFDYYFAQYPLHHGTFDMQRFRAAYDTQHDPEDVTGRVYLLAILVFEKLLFFDPRSPRGIWAIQTARDSLAWLDEALPGRLSSD